MKGLGFIYLFMFTLLLCGVSGEVVAEWSVDNVTWFNFSSVQQSSGLACQDNLSSNTEYFVRARDNNSGFVYESFWTLFEGLNEKMIEIALILIAVIGIFGFLGVKMEGLGSRIFFFGIAGLELLILLFVSYMPDFASVENILRLNFHGMLLVIGGICIYVVILFLMSKASPGVEEKEDFKWKDGK